MFERAAQSIVPDGFAPRFSAANLSTSSAIGGRSREYRMHDAVAHLIGSFARPRGESKNWTAPEIEARSVSAGQLPAKTPPSLVTMASTSSAPAA